MTVIVDYGMGNLFSLCSSLEAIGVTAVVSSDPEVIKNADRIILPGVGAFADAAKKLRETGLDGVLKAEAERGKPLLGVCLGMQLLFDKSFEYGEHEGLGLIPGTVEPISAFIPPDYKIPHIGWNALIMCNESPIFKYCKTGDHVYFVHSYCAVTGIENVAAQTEYGAIITAAVQRENVFGCQFHPEKSGDTGLAILKAFCEVS